MVRITQLGTGNAIVVEDSANPDTTPFVVSAAGDIGGGTQTPASKLHIIPGGSQIAGLFSGTTSADMIRITQLGSGNAITVEDSANPDANPFIVDSAGDVGIGTITSTAALTIRGGTTSASTAPIKILTGSLMNAAETGAIEYDGTNFYASPNANFGRGTIPSTNYTSGAGTNLTATGEVNPQLLFPTANDTITLSAGTYYLTSNLFVTRGSTSNTSSALRIALSGAGTAIGTFFGYSVGFAGAPGGGSASHYNFSAVSIGSSITISPATLTAAGVYQASLTGIMKITTGGTFIPRYSLTANLASAGTASTCSAHNYMMLQALDTQNASNTGPPAAGWA